MTYATMSTADLRAVYAKALEAAKQGETRGLKDKHPLMRAAHSVVGATSAELARRKA